MRVPHNAGQFESIKNYCLSDVAQTSFMLLRYRLVQGVLDLTTYRRAAQTLLDALEADGRVGPVVAALDRARVLLSD